MAQFEALRREGNPVRRFLGILGPGLITGASDDDPSGIGTYAQAGATIGLAGLWTALFTFPLTTTVQYICAKVGLVRGEGLAGVLRARFPRGVLYPVVLALAIANTINVGVDIGAIAAGLNILVPLPPALFVVPVAILVVVLLVVGSYALISRVFRWLTLALFGYIGAAFFARPELGEVLRNTLLPTIRFEPSFVLTIQAILGTTISPYLFFFQAEDEVENEIKKGRRTKRERQGAADEERFQPRVSATAYEADAARTGTARNPDPMIPTAKSRPAASPASGCSACAAWAALSMCVVPVAWTRSPSRPSVSTRSSSRRWASACS